MDSLRKGKMRKVLLFCFILPQEIRMSRLLQSRRNNLKTRRKQQRRPRRPLRALMAGLQARNQRLKCQRLKLRKVAVSRQVANPQPELAVQAMELHKLLLKAKERKAVKAKLTKQKTAKVKEINKTRIGRRKKRARKLALSTQRPTRYTDILSIDTTTTTLIKSSIISKR